MKVEIEAVKFNISKVMEESLLGKIETYADLLVSKTAMELLRILREVSPVAKKRKIWREGREERRKRGKLKESWQIKKESSFLAYVFSPLPYAIVADRGRKTTMTLQKSRGAFVFHVDTKKDKTLIQMHKKGGREWIFVKKFTLAPYEGHRYSEKALKRLDEKLPQIIERVNYSLGMGGAVYVIKGKV